ncbi:MAG: hypothetical protein KAI18_01230 [Candidatus Aenigmarchaeota archaeon]|nr:hypothetical protein [Candidatus Aenigmarchaeota archaeon]
MIIHNLHAEKILDSRGNWTVRAYVNGISGTAPSGASTGTYEAKVIPADKAVDMINTKLQRLVGESFNQTDADILIETLDGTDNFDKIGGNTAIAVSFAVFNAIHNSKKITKEIFPYPLGNVFGGGAHGGSTTFQEFLALPTKAGSMYEALDTNVQLHKRLRETLNRKAKTVGINDEGALTADIDDFKALDIITDLAEDVGCRIGLDVAASEFFNKGKYTYRSLKRTLTPEDQLDFLTETAKKYRLAYIEDPFEENDFKNTQELTKKIGNRCLVCGDDLFVTDEKRLQKGITLGAANSLIIKPNQAGTISLAQDTMTLAKKHDITPIVSHRSGETEDSTISRLALFWGAPIIKAGVIDMRISKLNELIHLWNMAETPKMAKLKLNR